MPPRRRSPSGSVSPPASSTAPIAPAISNTWVACLKCMSFSPWELSVGVKCYTRHLSERWGQLGVHDDERSAPHDCRRNQPRDGSGNRCDRLGGSDFRRTASSLQSLDTSRRVGRRSPARTGCCRQRRRIPRCTGRPAIPGRCTSQRDEDVARIRAEMKGILTPDEMRTIDIRTLPEEIARRRARSALPAAALRGARRPLQRDVRLGQLLHPGRPAARRRGRAGARHGRQLPLRDRALRHDPEREPHLLPDAVAAAVPDADDPGRLRADAATGRGCARRVPAIEQLLPVLDDRSRTWSRDRACRATSTSARARRPRWSATSATRSGPHALRPRRASTTGRTRSRDYDERAYYDAAARPPHAALLQGRPLDARVGLRSVEPLRAVQRRHHPLRARCA